MKQLGVWILCVASLRVGCPVQSSSSPLLIIDDVTVINVGSGAPTLPHRTVIVRDGHIEQVVQTEALRGSQPEGVRIDGKGKFLIPGLWDMHVHMVFGGWFPRGKEISL